MKSLLCAASAPLVLSACLSAAAQAPASSEPEPALQDVIIVTAARLPATQTALRPGDAPPDGADLTLLAARSPGAARIANGALSGQMAYRGLFGERLNLRVDGQRFASGGPNLMDPVFHYAPTPLVAALVIDRGVSPVSKGPGLGGGADAVFKKIDFADGASPQLGYDVSASARSVDDSVSAGGVIGAATGAWRVNLLGAIEEGGDYAFKDGEVAGSGFERIVYGLSAGARGDWGVLSLDLRRQNTGDSGNPPFPMDIRFFDQRPAPPAMSLRETFADATTRSGDVSAGFDAFGGSLTLGLDAEQVSRNVVITNPANANFFVSAFPDIDERRLGAFAEWRGALGPFEAELGLRADRAEAEAGVASLGPALPMGPRNLAAAFNAADRSAQDDLVDAVARLWTPAQNGLSWRLTLARKERAPGYIQRFGWLPINASGGLADGNIYVGDLSLEPETALIAEAGFDLAAERAYLRPTLYVRQVDGFIQGAPFDATPGVVNTPVEMIAAMNGDATPLRWTNVDARLWGLDADAGFDFDGPWRVDAVFSYVRGDRRDIDDALYRIAPPSLTLALTRETQVWSATLEARAVAEQTRVSRTNDEAPSKGYAVVSAWADWRIDPSVTLTAGVENLFDQVARDHLSGYNRNGFGDAGLGERLPAPGRGVFIRVSAVR